MKVATRSNETYTQRDTRMEYGTYLIGRHQINGALAEICSTLFQDADFVKQVLGTIPVEKIAQVFDTRHPAEERVKPADEIVSQVTLNSRLGRWLPMHHLLNRLEFSSAFYPGYRDHSIHSLQVFLLGWYLYLNCTVIRESLAHSLRLRATDPGYLSDFELFQEWWTIASLWHDLGYPFEATSFIPDTAFRTKLLQELSKEFGTEPFRAALMGLKPSMSSAELRELYRHGKYYPWELKNTDSLFTESINTPINEMWKRLGASAPDPTAAVITLTTQTPAGRPSYWDHGLMGGLILSAWWNEVEQFVISFAESSPIIDNIVPFKERESAALDVMSLAGSATCAIEAIAFHNIALHQWSANDLRPLFEKLSSYRSPSLNNESHLFFLALCDTLQDWDRHHFSPTTVANYRPAVPSSSMLLQAKDTSIAVALDSPDPVATVKKLFKDWLDNSDIDRLFTSSPQYTYPTLVSQLDPQITVAHVSGSKQTLDRMTQTVIQMTSQIRETLITDSNTAVLKIGYAVDDGLTELKRLETRLLPGHRSDFYDGDDWRQLVTVQSMACATIGVNTAVTKGMITSKLGDGGFGVVYSVLPSDTSAGNLFAYKVYHSADLSNSPKRELFRRGFDAMRHLKDNPGVVDVFEFTEFPVGFYMRLINGPDMLQGLSLLSDLHQRIHVLEQIGRILVYAHQKNIYHRDIKPANVILDSERNHQPVLTDFDLAWISGRSTITSAAFASMLYGAPEQFEDRLSPLRSRPTVDVFSFGKLMYYVLTDQEPPPLASFDD